MAYMTFDDQVDSHIQFLRDECNLDVNDLEIVTDKTVFTRCRGIGYNGRGEYAYRTMRNKMDQSGLVGLFTWCRTVGGAKRMHRTYGQDGKSTSVRFNKTRSDDQFTQIVRRNKNINIRCLQEWGKSRGTGESRYLLRKNVGAYGIRFQEYWHGDDIAVIPIRDINMVLQSLQFIYPGGDKAFLREASYAECFHVIGGSLTNGKPLGIAEGYVTAASCYELTGLPVICAFTAANLFRVARIIHEHYPESRIIIFADNDRHHGIKNKGVYFAEKALAAIGDNAIKALPDFGNIIPSGQITDWNDLIRVKGNDEARLQITRFI